VLVLIGWRIQSGDSTIGDFTGFVTALILAAQPLRALGNLHAIAQEAMASLQRTFAVMDEAPEIVSRSRRPWPPPQGRRGSVRGRALRLWRPRGALDGIDLVAEPGRTTALVGRSGSGKSTLLSLVPRLYDVAGGRVWWTARMCARCPSRACGRRSPW
jgi:subfamily B ATP-binding cassette protein MsbA